MKREDLLKEMKSMVGNKEPVEFFSKMVDMFSLLFDRIDELENDLYKVKTNSALAIQWDQKVANDMLARQIDALREDKETYHTELSACKLAYAKGEVVASYDQFCKFWLDTLGYHPFLDYDK